MPPPPYVGLSTTHLRQSFNYPLPTPPGVSTTITASGHIGFDANFDISNTASKRSKSQSHSHLPFQALRIIYLTSLQVTQAIAASTGTVPPAVLPEPQFIERTEKVVKN